MKKAIIISLFLVSIINSYAQITISGTVRDSIGNPLEMANIIALNTIDSSLEGYATTDEKGHYKIKIAKRTTVLLKVTYLGFTPKTKILVLTEQETTKDFVLNPANVALEGVEVVYEMPVTIKGDTIVYNADSFTSGNEKKLGDVLKKIPGVEVNNKGEIEVEGKTVSKIMVEGKDFFDGDTKLATKNIPADAIEKIEVLKNYNEISQMSTVNSDNDQIAINIKLKDGKKNFWFGEITAGTGSGDGKTRYLAHPKLFYYSPKKSVNIITDTNNMGEIPFTFQDYFKFTGGFKNMMKSGGINLSSNSLGLSFLKDNKAKEVKNDFIAINYSQTLTNKLNFNCFLILSQANNEVQTNTTSTITNTNLIEQTENINLQKNKLGLLKLSLTYKPNTKFQWNYDVLSKFSDSAQNNHTSSFSTLNGAEQITSQKNEKPFSIKQNTNFYYTHNDKNILALSAQYLFEKGDLLYNTKNTRQHFTTLPIDIGNSVFDVSQNKKNNTNQFNTTLDYYYILNKKSHLNFSIGTVFNKQTLQSNIYQKRDDNSILDFTAQNLNNNVQFNYSDVFVGMQYKIKLGIFTLNPGLSLHQYSSKNKQLNVETKKTPFYVLPSFKAKIALKKSETIQLNYDVTTKFTDIKKVSKGVLYQSYNALSYGNSNLNNALYHNYNLSYFNFNSFSFTNINASISYIKKDKSITNAFAPTINTDSKYTYLNNIEKEEDLRVNLRITKRFWKMKIATSGVVSKASINRLTIISPNSFSSNKIKQVSQNYTISIESNFLKQPNFELGYEVGITNFDNSKSTNQKLYANVEVNFLKHFTWLVDYNYNQFLDSNNNKNNYAFLNTDLYFQKEGSSWEFKASAINLLNTKSIKDDYFSTNYISTSNYVVQPRYLLFTVKYNL
jgi:hypothetical protein